MIDIDGPSSQLALETAGTEVDPVDHATMIDPHAATALSAHGRWPRICGCCQR